MKKSLFLGCLLLWGCAVAPNQNVKVFGQITDETGNHQLVLRFVEVDRPAQSEGKAYNFYSLAWEAKDGAKWSEKVIISRADFQKGSQRRRWVAKVRSFDPGTGCAILQIGEEEPRDAAGATHVTYSWREWDVANNQEVRVIRVCQDPFEPFEKGRTGG